MSATNFTVTVPHNITPEDMGDIVDLFFSDPYWVESYNIKNRGDAKWACMAPAFGGTIEVEYLNGDDTVTAMLNEATLQAGLWRLADKHPAIAARLVSGDYDYNDSDLLVQFALLGEVVFG